MPRAKILNKFERVSQAHTVDSPKMAPTFTTKTFLTKATATDPQVAKVPREQFQI